jgi:hypothetical protein
MRSTTCRLYAAIGCRLHRKPPTVGHSRVPWRSMHEATANGRIATMFGHARMKPPLTGRSAIALTARSVIVAAAGER